MTAHAGGAIPFSSRRADRMAQPTADVRAARHRLRAERRALDAPTRARAEADICAALE